MIVTYHFPPIVSAGVYRLLGLTRKLSELGWHVTVLTVRVSPFDLSDDESLRLIPEAVDRAGKFESLDLDVVPGLLR